ncbi:MAG TPA: dihydrofolate reductase family protein [Methylomirabilota bacterium]|nr:dihydrofolate reductase family protein [Methylomirabilota bacterium]
MKSSVFIRPASARPFVVMNMAMTADGKIASANRAVSTFGSRRDLEHLYELRATADAVMAGARTLDLNPVLLGPGGERFKRMRLKNGLSEYGLRVVVSGSGSIRPDAAIFQKRFSPIILLTTGRASRATRERLGCMVDEVVVCGRREIDFGFALRWLRERWNVQRLLCEGGGELNAALFRAGLVDELHLTLCPLIFGGRRAPTIAEGTGWARLADAAQLTLTRVVRVRDELFLTYRRVGAER